MQHQLQQRTELVIYLLIDSVYRCAACLFSHPSSVIVHPDNERQNDIVLQGLLSNFAACSHDLLWLFRQQRSFRPYCLLLYV